jgi:large subunit ribosomal protein L18
MKQISGRMKRKLRVRRKIRGSAARPRMSVYRSLDNVYVQVIDDDRGVTVAHANSLEEALRDRKKDMDKTAVAKEVGKLAAERCKGAGIKSVVFDRGGCKYIGRVAAVAEGAREGGLDL